MSKRSLWARVGSMFSRRLRQQHAMEEFQKAMAALKEAGEILRELQASTPSKPATRRISAAVIDGAIHLVVPTKVGAPVTIRLSPESARKLAEALKKSAVALEVN